MSLFNLESQRTLIGRVINDYIGSSTATDAESDGEEEDHDVEQLSAEDNACNLELQFIEDRFLDYSQSPFNIAELQFISPSPGRLSVELPSEPTVEELLAHLPAASPSTKQLNYRAQGYDTLISKLKNLACSAAALDTRRSNLLVMVSVERSRLISSVHAEYISQLNMGSHHEGLRRIHFASPNAGRFMSPIVTAIIVLIAIVHCMMGVARDNCNLVLRCLQSILRMAANMQDARAHIFSSNHIDCIPITLPTALHYLGLQDHLVMYVVCPACDAVYKEDSGEVPNLCTEVDINGQLCNRELFSARHRGNNTWWKPIRRFSHQPLESWLSRLLSRPGIEDMLESSAPSLQSTCTDVWGAPHLSNFDGTGPDNFFSCPSDELRLAFLLYHDFFNPYGNKISGKKDSIGIVMMVCLNLPPDVRYDLKNIYVTAMIPGPKEPRLEHINHFMRPIVDNLCEHYKPGIYISKTHKYPKGRKVRSATPITSLDIPASRAFAGLGAPGHTIFCSFCDATLPDIDRVNLCFFHQRSMADHRLHVQRWLDARNTEERDAIWKDHAARYSEWLRFPWWNPFTGTTVAPLHWTKNVLEKQIRVNMGCSTTVHAGIPEPPPLSRLLTTAELQWGYLAMLHLSASDFEKTKLTEPLLRYLCRERDIFEAGLPSRRLAGELNIWRRNNFVINADGSPARPEQDEAVAVAKAEYFLGKMDETPSALNSSTVSTLRRLSDKFLIPWRPNDKKAALVEHLVEYYKKVKIILIPEKPRSKQDVAIMGLEVVAEIKQDMKNTTIPSWLKTPPINFATADHGKLAGEEFKSLSIVSLPITLVRLWSTAEAPLRRRLDHFLHLSVAVRILAYQSLTSHDISLFEFHYQQYVDDLKALYPFRTVSPVQHLGLHLPFFLRELGPTTRYSENTCEMFIGILQGVPTNSRLGDLEQTLHRELIMASNLKAMIDQQKFSGVLQPYGEILAGFLQNRYPGSERPSSTSWNTAHGDKPISLDQKTYAALCEWAKINHVRPYTRHLLPCTKLQRGNVVYQPSRESSGNSNILFRPRGSIPAIPGRIEGILQEPEDAVGILSQPRVVLLVRSFKPLNETDEKRDPFANHPIVGRSRFGIMGLFYKDINADTAHILEVDDVVSHIAVSDFSDPAATMSARCVVVVDLDLKHTLHV